MADRHENNWQAVRPLDDDTPDGRVPEPAAPPVSPEPTTAARVAAAEAVPDAKPVVQREPFRSTPITMPPEGVDNPPIAAPEATRTPVSAPASTEPAVAPKSASGPTAAGVKGENGSTASSPADIAPVRPEVASAPKPTELPKPSIALGEEPTRVQQRPAPSVTPPQPKQIQSPPVPSEPPPPQTWMPQNQVGPQNQWSQQNQWPQQNQWQPNIQGGPQNQWVPQPGQWPRTPDQQRMAPHQTHQWNPGPAESVAVAPGVVPTIGPGRSGDHPVIQSVSSRDLGNSLLVRSADVPPVAGWRRALYMMSGGRIDVGNSAAQQRRLELTAQVDRTLVGCYRVAVLSLKGGVGKTTTTATLGSTFADIRGDRVIAIDANPDRGTLGQKVPSETTATVRNLLRDMDSLDRYSDVRAYTSQNVHRLEVLASDSDPAASEAFSGKDYDRTVELLEKFYSIVITDCGTGLMHSAMESILEGADTLVVVSSASVDGARSASATLDWLDAHGYRALVSSSVAVVNGVRPRAGKVDLQKVVEHFEQRCAQVRTIPFDPHLEEGAEIELNRLRGCTRKALLEVAAAVAAGFPDSTAASRHS